MTESKGKPKGSMLTTVVVAWCFLSTVGLAVYSYDVLTDDPDGDRMRNSTVVQASVDEFDGAVLKFRNTWATGRKDDSVLRFLAGQHKTISGMEHFLRPDGRAAVVEYRQALSALAIVVNDMKPGEGLTKFDAGVRWVNTTRPAAAAAIKDFGNRTK